ncbi:hypothetical protein PYW07_015654 [Mythimna separata]|uniref:Uncharacterized protein n=1 Tax=Mythimna separata TaxID=271217 RepID=A0AAD7Z0P5_MYTSE|nr:hypothetical protein PYW07_015654 [Mythimna separata]
MRREIIQGRKNLIRDGIISCDGGFRDLYDENIQPQMTDEYVYVQRWFHTIQETTMKNPLVKCSSSKIGKLDLSAWKEGSSTCKQ